MSSSLSVPLESLLSRSSCWTSMINCQMVSSFFSAFWRSAVVRLIDRQPFLWRTKHFFFWCLCQNLQSKNKALPASCRGVKGGSASSDTYRSLIKTERMSAELKYAILQVPTFLTALSIILCRIFSCPYAAKNKNWISCSLLISVSKHWVAVWSFILLMTISSVVSSHSRVRFLVCSVVVCRWRVAYTNSLQLKEWLWRALNQAKSASALNII